MSENPMETQWLKGPAGWLVLFQIYIIMAVATSIQTILLGLAMGNIFDFGAYRPYYYVLLAVAFAIALVCMILFYRRKMAFRLWFIAYSVVSIISSVLYNVFGANVSYTTPELIEYASSLTSFTDNLSYVSLVISLGITAALIIALFKSQRVKNTFS